MFSSPTLNPCLSHIRLSLIIAFLTHSYLIIFKTHKLSLSVLVSDSQRSKANQSSGLKSRYVSIGDPPNCLCCVLVLRRIATLLRYQQT